MQFEDLNLRAPLLKAVREQGYGSPTPIQEQAIPHVLSGRDVLGCAQTGTGKTAAFALPMLQHLDSVAKTNGKRVIRALVLAPTRELALQIKESFATYGKYTNQRATVVFGGVHQNTQTRDLIAGVDILAATPGRLLDLMNQGFVDLHAVEVFVLDEADRMLDLGFVNDIRKIVRDLPRKRQTMLFSATLPPDIRQLAKWILTDPVTVSISPPGMTLEQTEQRVFFVERNQKTALLAHVLAQQNVTRALVFTRTKRRADDVVRCLNRAAISAEAIHGNKSQINRQRALDAFKQGASRVLVATDIASRGLDIEQISHVINFDLPHEPEAYVHRIGRTSRAGSAGAAFSFCGLEERPFLAAIERLIHKRLAVEVEHPFRSSFGAPEKRAANLLAGRRYSSRPGMRTRRNSSWGG